VRPKRLLTLTVFGKLKVDTYMSLAEALDRVLVDHGSDKEVLVDDTGIEPVASSVTRKRHDQASAWSRQVLPS
jgi:hypothetical protein